MTIPEERREAGRWLRYAQEDLDTAVVVFEQKGVVPREVCWLAQRAAEKALKAGLVLEQIDFPRTHNLHALRNLLPADWQTRRSALDLAQLTRWSVEARYPGGWSDPTRDDAALAVSQAEAMLASIRADLTRRGFLQEQ